MAIVTNIQNLYADNQFGVKADNRYSELAAELKEHDGIVVGVFWDEDFAGHEVPKDLSFSDIERVLGSIPGVKVVALNADQVRSYSLVFKGKMDVIIYPYGGTFPMDSWAFYSAYTFNHYIRRGGAVITTGDIPFMRQAMNSGHYYGTETEEGMLTVFDRWVSKFGIKYYEPEIAPTKQRANTDFLPSLEEYPPFGPNRYGVVANNSSHSPVPKPSFGNVFPERYPARQVIPLMTGLDKYGQYISTSAILTQDFEVGCRRIHFTHDGDNHPLSPNSGCFDTLMKDLFRLIMNKVIATDIEAEYACYHQGESVNIRTQINSFEDVETPVTAIMEVLNEDEVVYTESREIKVNKGKEILKWTWAPENFNGDEFSLKFTIKRDGYTVSQADNGFVVWDDSKIRNDDLAIRNEYFTINGKGTYISGTNYYESTRGEIMWFRPNTANIIRDYRQMHSCGVNMIRPHYHFQKWFKDYLTHCHDELFEFFEELNDCNSYMPDEKGWRIWDMFIYLSHKYGIIYNGDLFTLVPEELGDPRGWFGTVEAVYDTKKHEAQKEFLRAIETRYSHLKGIAWDLFNEPVLPDSEIREWARILRDVFLTDLKSDRLITVGGPMELGDEVDFDTPHGAVEEEYVNTRKRPFLLQELHFDKPESLHYEHEQAEGLRRMIVSGLRSGVCGCCPWSWSRQMRLWQDAYEQHYTFPMEKWDDRLGMHTHDDATMKVAGLVFKDLAHLLDTVDFVEYDPEAKNCITTKGRVISFLTENKPDEKDYSVYHANDTECFASMAYGKIAWAGKDLINGPAEKFVYFFTDGDDFNVAKTMYVKSEGEGAIILNRTGVKAVELVDYTPDAAKKLADVTFEEKDGKTVITNELEMTRYWIKVTF